jgi:hypothetical protein
VLDLAARERALDQLLAQGVTPQWLRAADVFEGLADRLDATAVRAIRLQDTNCAAMREFRDSLGDAMNAVCGFAALFPTPATAEACAFSYGAWVGAYLAVFLLC